MNFKPLSITALIFFVTFSASTHAARLSVLFGGGSSGGNEKAYVRAFVTSTTYDGNLGGIAGADAKCQTRADAASLGGTWKAIISDSSTTALSRNKNRVKPIYELSGRLVMNPSAPGVLFGETSGTVFAVNALFGGSSSALPTSISITELGTTPGTNQAWTGTSNMGVSSGSSCTNWTSNSSGVNGTYGNSSSVAYQWIIQGGANCANTYRLYCLEDE